VWTTGVVLALAAPPSGEAASSPATGLRALAGHADALVALEHGDASAARWALLAHGGERLSPDLELWRVPGPVARRLVPRLAREGRVRGVWPDLRPGRWPRPSSWSRSSTASGGSRTSAPTGPRRPDRAAR
jgi:hypothetical protein